MRAVQNLEWEFGNFNLNITVTLHYELAKHVGDELTFMMELKYAAGDGMEEQVYPCLIGNRIIRCCNSSR